MIRRQVVKPDEEYLVLGGMIMDKSVLSTCYLRFKNKELKANHFTPHFRPVFRWLIRYYRNQKKAPKKSIQDIYERNKKRLSNEAQEIVEEYLDTLAEKYAAEQENIDTDYIRTEVLPDFIRQREIANKIEQVQNQLDSGDYERAEESLASYHRISVEEEDEHLGTFMPFTIEDIEQNINQRMGDAVYRFSGDMNWLVGPLCRTWLVAMTGIEKAGKSYFLQEIGYEASLYQRKKVLEINFELSDGIKRNRVWRRIGLTSDERGKHLNTILDCKNNQDRTCQVLSKSKMPNKSGLFRTPDDVVSFYKHPDWVVCTKCKDSKTRKNASKFKRYIPAIWFEKDKLKNTTERRLKDAVIRKRFLPLKNYRVKCFPRFSMTFDETYDYIMRYTDKQKFQPDIITFDYLDIMASEHSEPRIDIDRKWKKAAKLAGELNCLVLTADQATKAGRTQYALDQMSTSESKTKDSHLDVRIAINQMDEEKELNIARLSVLFHRHAKFSIKKEVMVTQRLETAEPMIDSAFLYERAKQWRVINKKF